MGHVRRETPRFEVIADGLALPEGPLFLDGELWCVEILGGNLVKLDTHGPIRYATGGEPNGLAVDDAGRLWMCDRGLDAVLTFDRHSATFETMATHAGERRLNKCNDLAFDSQGNLVFTCPSYSPDQGPSFACCMAPDGSVTVIRDDMCFCNGLAFVDGDTSLIIAETGAKYMMKGSWNPEHRVWEHATEWAEVREPGIKGGPDGMALGPDGLLYVAMWNMGVVKAFDSSGRLVRVLETPGRRPTNCAFDPHGRLGLVVTVADTGCVLSCPDIAQTRSGSRDETEVTLANRG